MSIMKNKQLELQQNINDFLDNSECFGEFLENSDTYFAELMELEDGEEPLSDDINARAREIWDEHVNRHMPF